MCGICGIASHKSGGDLRAVLASMNEALTHRGPDDGGAYVNAHHGLAMRRLSIIDVDGGHQPVFNEDGQIVIVFNGEIYNFPELRDDLLRRGHVFETHSDTEVIVHLYEEKAERTPEYLKGMFAFCIYDRRDDSLFLARDRFGEKPLYYYHDPRHGFFFSSEIRSLLASPVVPRVLNTEALGYYLRIGYVPSPMTMLAGVKILPAGHWLRLSEGGVVIRPYFTINYSPDRALEDEGNAIDAVRAALQQAVRRQAISDVPLGAFLSGGIDSSSVAAMLQAVSSQPIKTFNVRFEEARYDESAIARQVAQHLGTEHYEFVVPNVAFEPDHLWRIIAHVGLPFLDTSAIPTYILSKHIRQEVKVALSGDGGDEMFAGYPVFQWAQKIQRLQKLPHPFLAIGAAATNQLSRLPAMRQAAFLRKIRRGFDSATVPPHLLPVAIHTLFEPHELERLVQQKDVLNTANGDLGRYTQLPPESEAWTPLRRLMYLRLKNNLHDDMLVKVDRMSMAASLEVRAPMLDVDLAALTMRLPDKHLIRGNIGKFILRQAMKPMLPDIVFSHSKTGFSIPLHTFQNENYKTLAADLLQNQDGIMQLFPTQSLENILQKGLVQKKDNATHSVYRASHQLWNLMQLSAWGAYFNVTIP